MSTAREDELRAEVSRLRTELKAAEEALTQERFKDVPRLAVGTEVLVPRKLFGKTRPWPAKIVNVHLSYNSGETRDGEPWEHRTVSYGVFLRQADGEYGGSSEGFYAKDVQVLAAGGPE
jgi:hypothetical protein